MTDDPTPVERATPGTSGEAAEPVPAQAGPGGGATVIVIGNQKGGSGKTTVAMHLAIALMRMGHRVGTLDLDWPQSSLARYVENRQAFIAKHGARLPVPEHATVRPSTLEGAADHDRDEEYRFLAALHDLAGRCAYVVVDTPGTDSALTREAHSHGDILITPMNDSFVDLDVLAVVDMVNFSALRPSHYAEAVWAARKARAARNGGSIDWVVMRNRLSPLMTRSKRDLTDILAMLGKRFGFRAIPGFTERVIYRELFPNGLTLLDMRYDGGVRMTMSHVAAREELRELVEALGIRKAVKAGAGPEAEG